MIWYFFIEKSTLSNYADDNNLFISGEHKALIKSLLCSNFKIVENWIFENCLVLNSGDMPFYVYWQKC